MKKQIKQTATLMVLILCSVFLKLSVSYAQTTDVIVMDTSLGSVEIELYGNQAPITVANFLALIDGQHLDGGEIYRVVTYGNDNGSPKIEVIQGGLNDRASPFVSIPHESTELTGISHTDGVISMARGEVGTASSEFFICIGDQPGLDYGQPRNADGQGFAAFGKVVRGMDIVRRIKQLGEDSSGGDGYTAGQILSEPLEILSVRRKT